MVGAGVLTAIIFGIWFSGTSDPSQIKAETESKLSSISPIQLIKEEFTKVVSSFGSTHSTSSEQVGTSTVPIEVIESNSTTTQ